VVALGQRDIRYEDGHRRAPYAAIPQGASPRWG
jgi:hypothetical protein